MSTLAELEAMVEKERQRLRRRSSRKTTGQAKSADRSTAQSRRRRAGVFNAVVDYTVPDAERIDILAQPSKMTCWATVFTMLYGWKKQMSMTIDTALGDVGDKWRKKFQDDMDRLKKGQPEAGLLPSEKKDLVAAAGLIAEPPMNPSIKGWENLLRSYGPLWVTTDEAPGKAWAIHARLITAIKGDGTPAGTKFSIIDPAGGRQYTESIAVFVPKYEEEVRKTGYTRIQILHWPKDARYAAGSSLTRRSLAPATALSAPESFDIRYQVQLIPQQTGVSCWAAGAAMVVGWRDRISLPPYHIAGDIGYWKQYYDKNGGLPPDDTKMFAAWGLVPESPQTYTLAGFKSLLEQYGPLWVAAAVPGPHIRVVTGISGDGSPDGTTLYINDPWEPGMKAFRESNKGGQYTETYREFVAKQSELAASEMHVKAPIYVAHLPQLPLWYKGPVSQSYAEFMGMPLAMEAPANPANYRLLKSGMWTGNTSLSLQGGQGMWFKVTNMNVLGTTIRISDHLRQSKGSVILPQTTVNFLFTCFGNEPMPWKFDIRTESDVFMVKWELWSTWVPGLPNNPPGG